MTGKTLTVTDIASFVRLQFCGRYLAFQAGKGGPQVQKILDKYLTLADPAYQEVGLRSERALEEYLEKKGFAWIREQLTWRELGDRIREVRRGQSLFAREVGVEGEVGAFTLQGRLDFVLLRWEEGAPRLRILELKATRRDRSYHYAQLALYALLLEGQGLFWEGEPIPVEYRLVRADPGTLQVEPPLDPWSFEEEALFVQAKEDMRALLAQGGVVETILSAADPLEFSYLLNARCDACRFNVVCLRHGAERRDLELLGLPSDAVQALKEHGVGDLETLAEAKPQDLKQAVQQMESPLRPEHLVTKAQARLATLPQGRNRGFFPVKRLWDAGFGRLPSYTIDNKPLIRVYLVVEKDLVAERLNALVAHVTSGEEFLFVERPFPIGGVFVEEIRKHPWTGNPREDDRLEAEMIQGFFSQLVKRLREEVDLWGMLGLTAGGARVQEAPLHFYVWSQQDIKNLVEAILRVGPESGGLLTALWHLMGTREGLEELMFSALEDEVRTRYALGRTALSLITATTLFWPVSVGEGRKQTFSFPWTTAEGLSLRSLFRPWLFDFIAGKSDGYIEVRNRNYDTFPPVYWRAYWGKLPEPSPEEGALKEALEGAQRAAPHLPDYLRTRAIALRWLEERIEPKNKTLRKSPIRPEELPDFRLQAYGVVQTSLDFLRFEQQVRLNLWLADKTLPPELRVFNGTSLLVENLEKKSGEGNVYRARIRAYPEGASLSDLEGRVSLGPGDFVRVSEVNGPSTPQKWAQLWHQGVTARVRELDWDEGWVELEAIPFNRSPDRYVLPSRLPSETWSLAILDPSPSDYVARRVDEVLKEISGERRDQMDKWFDLECPSLPPLAGEGLRERAQKILRHLQDQGLALNERQEEAILQSLTHRVYLLQGPPGTGKTQVTAVALLLWAQLLLPERGVLGVAAATHTAVDTLLERVRAVQDAVRGAFEKAGEPWNPVVLLRVDPVDRDEDEVRDVPCTLQTLQEELHRKEPPPSARVLLFGTTNGLLKIGPLWRKWRGGDLEDMCALAKRYPDLMPIFALSRFPGLDLLVVDEASMMLFPHFLALAYQLDLSPDRPWRILLTGDHRQLAPVIQHQWEEENRPGVQCYLPYLSVFEAFLRIRRALEDPAGRVGYTVLTYTHRLPEEVRSLIQPLYRRDNVELDGRKGKGKPEAGDTLWEALWHGEEGVYLLVHNDRQGRKRNPHEAEIILRALEGAPKTLVAEDIAVVTPFRAQRTLLREKLRGRVGLVDTVERLQGGERRVIFYSASASDPNALTTLQEFLLDVNRTNVAFSRAKERLIVMVSETLLHYVPPEREAYEDAVLWKELRRLCRRQVGEALLEGGLRVRLLIPEGDGGQGSARATVSVASPSHPKGKEADDG